MLKHKSEHDTLPLNSLQWLPASLRITAKLFTTAYEIAVQRGPQPWHYLVICWKCRTAGPNYEAGSAFSPDPQVTCMRLIVQKHWAPRPRRCVLLALLSSAPTSLPLTHSSPVSLVFLPFLKHTRHSSPWLFPQTGMFPPPQVTLWLAPSPASLLYSSHLLSEAFPVTLSKKFKFPWQFIITCFFPSLVLIPI